MFRDWNNKNKNKNNKNNNHYNNNIFNQGKPVIWSCYKLMGALGN